MKVILITNIDAYQQFSWPEFTDHVPRKGEIIYLPSVYESTCRSRKIPDRLEVCAVRYKERAGETIAYVELWFNETDFKLYGGGEKLLS